MVPREKGLAQAGRHSARQCAAAGAKPCEKKYKTKVRKLQQELENLTAAKEKLDIENEEMRKALEESVPEMEKMTDQNNKMKRILQQPGTSMDQLRKENEQYKLQIQELSEQLKAKNEEGDMIMAAVDAKVEEWKEIFASKDAQILEYQQMLFNLNEKLKVAQLNEEKSSVLALQQAVEERDAQIRLLTEQMEQYTKEMEHNTVIIENAKSHLQNCKGCSSLAQQNHIEDMQEKLKELEERTRKAEKSAEIAEAEASKKDKELVETRKRMRDYERGIYGLEEAVAEIKDLKQKVKVREREIENLVQDVNKLELEKKYLFDENEELRERLGLDPKTMIDLNELGRTKFLLQKQDRLQNKILLQQIERLEEERIELKKQVRELAQEKGRTAAIEDREGKKCPREMSQVKTLESGVENGQEEHSGQMDSVEDLVERLRRELAPLRSQNEYLANELNVRERDLEKNKTVIAQFQSKVKELSGEKKQLEEGMKEILQAVKEMQNDPSVKGGETALTIPSLDHLVNAMECKTSEGTFDVNVHWRAQVDQLTGRNEELRQELKRTQEAAANFSHQLANANEKIAQLNSEICSLRHSEGASVVIRTMSLPEGMVPSSVTVINSLNESLLHLLQELENKEELLKKLEEAVEDYRRKFAVIRHQQGLLYKKYQREKESWQNESENMKKQKKQLEEQKEEDATKIKAYSNLLSALQMDLDETKKVLAENHRKITVLQVNERSLRRQCSALLETERHLRKENEKLKGEITDMETAFMGKIGNLQQWKEIAGFKIAALQNLLDHSVLMSEREVDDKQYNALTAKYRDMLQKDNLLVQRTTNMEHMESEEETGSVPDHSLPLPQQLELALRKIQEHVRTLAETRTTCKSLEEKLKEKETALCKAEENVLSRDKVINELRLQLHPASEREKIVPDLGKQEGDPACHHIMKIARQVVENMQQRLNHKEEVIKKYERWLAKAREEQEEMANKHEEDLRALHQKLYLHTDNSLNKFKETALEIVKRNSLSVSYKKLFLRFAEMRRTVAEQDNALTLFVGKLKKTVSDLEKQKEITAMKEKEIESLRAQLQDQYRVDREELKDEANKLRNTLAQTEMELATAKAELRAQREANRRAPTATVKHMLENLKSQLAMKEKQQKALSQAIRELRAEMTVNTEQQIISAASQKEANMNVQEIVDRQRKGLMTQVEELKNHITKLTDSLKISKAKETSLSDEMNELTQELEKKQRAFAKILTEKKEMEKENEELKKRIRRLSGAIQSKADGQNLIEALQKKNNESELEKSREETKKGVREGKPRQKTILEERTEKPHSPFPTIS
ncbi:LOW QUALITY PROTEIN: centrosomal protein of 290 kDa-like [Porphyrio hochstetteri]